MVYRMAMAFLVMGTCVQAMVNFASAMLMVWRMAINAYASMEAQTDPVAKESHTGTVQSESVAEVPSEETTASIQPNEPVSLGDGERAMVTMFYSPESSRNRRLCLHTTRCSFEFSMVNKRKSRVVIVNWSS